MALRILLNGARGRMGRAVAAAAAEAGLTVSAALDAGDDPAGHFAACDVVIDFSAPAATRALLELAVRHRKPAVIGTTGLSAGEKKTLLALAA
ncbi:MAG: 4-hydroxy-tetrahydrodipicolinate reductase, partial [Acetobacteraceae bacterium]